MSPQQHDGWATTHPHEALPAPGPSLLDERTRVAERPDGAPPGDDPCPRQAPGIRVLVLTAALGLAIVAAPSGAVVPLVVALAWVLVVTPSAWCLARRRAPGAPVLSNVATVGDVFGTAAIVAVSGGADSPVRWLLVATPVLWAFTRPRDLRTVVASGAVGYLVAALPDVLAGQPDLRRTLAGFFVAYLAASAAAVVMSRQRRAKHSLLARIRRLRTELAGQHHDRERRMIEDLVGRLHDGPLQLVATVGQDLDDHLAGVDVDLAGSRRLLLEASREMRTLNSERFAAVIGDADLAAALHRVAAKAARRGGPVAALSVGTGVAGRHDRLLQAATGELLVNVAKHAHATHAEVEVARGGDDRIVLTVTDDGTGMDAGARARAEAAGHTGLRHLQRRVEALGGELRTTSGRSGTTTRLSVPTGDAVAIPVVHAAAPAKPAAAALLGHAREALRASWRTR